jgi:hypothetical protein
MHNLNAGTSVERLSSKNNFFWHVCDLKQEKRIKEVPLLYIKYELSQSNRESYSLNEELKAKWDRLWHFFESAKSLGNGTLK